MNLSLVGYLCLYRFRAEVAARRRDRPESPLVVVDRGVVASATAAAAAAGVRIGMTEAALRRGFPDVEAVPSPELEAAGGRVWSLLCRWAPAVEPDVEGAFFLPAGRRGETPAVVASEILSSVRAMGFSATLGLAAGRYPARVLALWLAPRVEGTAEPSWRLVPHGEEADFLAPLPLSCLEMVPAATRQRLERLGIKTHGQLARLDADTLRSQFGDQGLLLWRLARGRDDTPVRPLYPPRVLHEEMRFSGEVRDADAVGAAAVRLGAALARRLDVGGLAPGCLTVTLSADSGESEGRVRLLHQRPGSGGLEQVARRLALEARRAVSWPCIGLQLEVGRLTPVPWTQQRFDFSSVPRGEDADARPERDRKRGAERDGAGSEGLQRVLTSLSRRYGEGAVRRGCEGGESRRERMLRLFDPMRFGRGGADDTPH